MSACVKRFVERIQRNIEFAKIPWLLWHIAEQSSRYTPSPPTPKPVNSYFLEILEFPGIKIEASKTQNFLFDVFQLWHFHTFCTPLWGFLLEILRLERRLNSLEKKGI